MKQHMLALLLGATLVFTACNNTNDQNDRTQDTTSTTNSASDTGTTTDTAVNTGDTMMGKPAHDMTHGLGAAMYGSMDSMRSMRLTGNYDRDFAQLMIAHHRGGIRMAEQMADSGQDAGLKQIAQRMIQKQRSDISNLENFIADHNASNANTPSGEATQLQTAVSDLQRQMNNLKPTGNFDKDFATMMIHHHDQAIALGTNLQQNGNSDKLKKLMNMQEASMKKDIAELNAWLRK